MVILSLLLDMVKHSQSTQSNKFVISLQYLEKEFRKGVNFLHADEQSSYKLGLLLLMEVARSVQSTQNRKLVIFFAQSVAAAFVFYCDTKHSDILGWFSHVYCYILVSLHSQVRNFLSKHHNRIIKHHLCGEGLHLCCFCSKLMFSIEAGYIAANHLMSIKQAKKSLYQVF